VTVRRSNAPVRRRLGGLLGALALLGAGACGFEVQTNQPYTPSVGVNIDAGPRNSLKIRDLKILSREAGSGILSASMTSSQRESLTGVSGVALKADGSEGAPLQATLPNPVDLSGGQLVVLTNGPLITVTSADLMPGLEARVVLQFSELGEISTTAPVVSAEAPEYRTITPSASPSPSG